MGLLWHFMGGVDDDEPPSEWFSTLGTDFIYNSKIPTIAFTSVHIYPDQWLIGAELDEKVQYISKWITSHIEDGDRELRKPVVFSEFGLSNKNKKFDHSHRDLFYKSIYDLIYKSTRKNGAGAGAFIWQRIVEGMEEYNDDYGFVPGERPSFGLLKKQSCRLARIRHAKNGGSKYNICLFTDRAIGLFTDRAIGLGHYGCGINSGPHM